MTKLEVEPKPRAVPETPEPEVTVLRPPGGWQVLGFGEIWSFRELLYCLTWRDVKVRYKQTLLGAAWAVLQPAMMMIVFTIFFGRLAGVPSGGIPYPLFAFTGLLPWTFFSTAVGNAGNSVVGSERLITKIYFPRMIVPFAAVAAALVDFVVAMSLLILLMIYYGVPLGVSSLLAPVILGCITLLALGLGTCLAALNVTYRDFRYVIPFLLQVGMFATPSIYMKADPAAASAPQPAASTTEEATSNPGAATASDSPKPAAAQGGTGLGFLLVLNPMTPLISAFRASILGGPIAWGPLATSAVASVAAFLLGCLYFRRVEDSFADII